MVRGLGVGPWDGGTTTTTTEPSDGGTTKPSTGDQVSSWLDKIFTWGSQAGDIYQATQNQPGGNGVPPGGSGGGGGTPTPGMSTTTKVMIGVGAVALVGAGVYAVARKKK